MALPTNAAIQGKLALWVCPFCKKRGQTKALEPLSRAEDQTCLLPAERVELGCENCGLIMTFDRARLWAENLA
jgi:uncharacterized protein YbaR (Trm112 family)